MYLVNVDRYSNWPIVERAKDGATGLTKILRQTFATYGIPGELSHLRHQEKWTEHTKSLPPLQVGNHERIQNQTGSHPLKWDRTGVVIEVRQFPQYLIKIDGSG